MEIEYSEHIQNRLVFRKTDYDLPRVIFEQPEIRYFDAETGHFIAVKKVNLYKKNREVMVAYTLHENCVTLLTIHPLKKGQKEKRVNTQRWKEL